MLNQNDLISQILSRPDLAYLAKKREHENIENAGANAPTDNDIAQQPTSLRDLADLFTKVAEIGRYTESVVDKACEELSVIVDQDKNPIEYDALAYLFADEFSGVMTYSMYKTLLALQYKIHKYNVDKAVA